MFTVYLYKQTQKMVDIFLFSMHLHLHTCGGGNTLVNCSKYRLNFLSALTVDENDDKGLINWCLIYVPPYKLDENWHLCSLQKCLKYLHLTSYISCYRNLLLMIYKIF